MQDRKPYLQDLGITAVELLPEFHYDAQDAPAGRLNYGGYAPVSFFAPHPAYSLRQDPRGPPDEFRDLVKALHRAGIDVILDVVFNHTADLLWQRWIDTALETPNDIAPWAKFPAVPGLTYRAEARSVVVLYAPAARSRLRQPEP